MLAETIEISHPRFERRKLSYQAPGLFTSQRILLNDEPASATKGRRCWDLEDDLGKMARIELHPTLLGQGIPKVTIDDENVEISPALKWFELLVSALPLTLILGGGGVGFLLGFIGTRVNLRLFRTARPSALKFGGAVAVGVVCWALWLVVAWAFHASGIFS